MKRYYGYFKPLFYYSSKGFTLVELLVVIAILGILAVVVLVAINPGEQIARGRDSARVELVSQVGTAMTRYSVSQVLATYPAGSATWQNSLVTDRDLQVAASAPSPTVACLATNSQNNICYAPLSSSSDYAIWINGIESTKEKNRLAACAGTVAAVYIGSKGKVQLDCLNPATSIPSTADTFADP